VCIPKLSIPTPGIRTPGKSNGLGPSTCIQALVFVNTFVGKSHQEITKCKEWSLTSNLSCRGPKIKLPLRLWAGPQHRHKSIASIPPPQAHTATMLTAGSLTGNKPRFSSVSQICSDFPNFRNWNNNGSVIETLASRELFNCFFKLQKIQN
jgi:hypothetical protein